MLRPSRHGQKCQHRQTQKRPVGQETRQVSETETASLAGTPTTLVPHRISFYSAVLVDRRFQLRIPQTFWFTRIRTGPRMCSIPTDACSNRIGNAIYPRESFLNGLGLFTCLRGREGFRRALPQRPWKGGGLRHARFSLLDSHLYFLIPASEPYIRAKHEVAGISLSSKLFGSQKG